MKSMKLFTLITLVFALLLAGCSSSTPAAQPTDLPAVEPTVAVETPALPAETEAPAASTEIPTVSVDDLPYVPVTSEICQSLQEMATQFLSLDFQREDSAPFTDPIGGDTGEGCQLTTTASGADFESPQLIVDQLAAGFIGWTRMPEYQADGPTGSAVGMSRDMGLLLISANWAPAEGVTCPADQPIGDCDLQPEEKVYTITVQAAMK
ncbi:MAG TPA: hypothetical protein VHO48_06555 [Anaerolineaceae bacterium]|nr:hypothetical protein [Anaerolineaceae bacterium]